MPRPRLLTKEQVLDAINRWQLSHGAPPTIEELRRALKLGSTRTVLRYLSWLEEEGDIERWPGARGLRTRRVPRKGVQTVAVPLVGEAPAGPLMAAEENLEGWVRFPRASLHPPSAKFFLLRVRGDSMNRARVAGDRIQDGDLVMVRQQATAQPGDIVVALIDGEATIKRLIHGSGFWVLKPESRDPKHQPIVVGQNLRVQGIVVRVLSKGSKLLNLIEG